VCTLAIYFRLSDTYPVAIAANRDEFYERETRSPAVLCTEPWVVAGQDLVAGGTWLGVNEHGLVAGIVNRRTAEGPDPSRLSRGMLCLHALRQPSAAAAVAAVPENAGTAYNAFNLLLASPEEAWVIGNAHGALKRTRLDPGLHLLTNLDLNDATCPRIAKSYSMFESAARHLRQERTSSFRSAVREILSDHSTPLDPRAPLPSNNLCVHTERFGTRSSSLILYGTGSRGPRLWHAEGPPCKNDYVQIALPPHAHGAGTRSPGPVRRDGHSVDKKRATR
jgi:uncharacterized protein with NRDE domain